MSRTSPSPLFPSSPATRRYTPLSSRDLPAILRLIRSDNVGPVTFFELMRRFGTPGEALRAIPELSVRGGRKQPITLKTEAQAMAEIEATRKAGASFVVYGEASYPPMLTGIYDPPPLLAVRGDTTALHNKEHIAIVGARNASMNGCTFARKLATDLGKEGYSIASGLARGIDTHAHIGALATGTIAVIACGIDKMYPPENAELAARIAESGAIVSEQALGMMPHATAFPARNRIISGMARGCVIVEANERSGSLITARYAAEEGREVFAVPGSPLDPRCKGTNGLLKEGAIITESAQDVLTALHHAAPRIGLNETASRANLEETISFQDIDEYSPPRDAHEEVGHFLSPSPIPVDELVKSCHIPANVILTILLELELAGRLERHPGGKVSLVAANI